MSDPDQKFDIVPWLVLGGVVLSIALSWWLFPILFKMIQQSNCIAAGYVNC